MLLSKPIGCQLNVNMQLEYFLTKLSLTHTHTHTYSPIHLHSTQTHALSLSKRESQKEWARASARTERRPFSSGLLSCAPLRLCEWESGKGYARFYLLIEFRAPPTFGLALWAPSVAPSVGHACDRDRQSRANCRGNTQNEKFSSFGRQTATVKWSTLPTLRLTVSLVKSLVLINNDAAATDAYHLFE